MLFLFLSNYIKSSGAATRHWWSLREEEIYFRTLLDLGTTTGWVVSITPRPRFNPEEKIRDTHCRGGWVDPRADLDAEVRGIILCLRRVSNPCRPARSKTLCWLSYRKLHGTKCHYTAGCQNIKVTNGSNWCGLQCHNFHINFHENRQIIQTLKWTTHTTHTHRIVTTWAALLPQGRYIDYKYVII
jgi:hypothetical protein